MRLDGKVAFVTGSGRNLGRATALRFARAGASIGVQVRENREEGEETVELIRQLGQEAHLVVGDVADPQVPGRMVDEIVERFGRLDVFVYSIGIRPHGTILDLAPEEWQRVMDVNLNGAFYASQAAARAMVKAGNGGSIINVTGSAAAQGKKGRPHVVASKTGLLGYTRALAAELGEYGIRANSIAPVNLQDTSRPQEWYPTPIPTTVNKASPVPLGRHGTTDDIVEVMLFLASDASRYMTGQALNVNGGVYMQ